MLSQNDDNIEVVLWKDRKMSEGIEDAGKVGMVLCEVEKESGKKKGNENLFYTGPVFNRRSVGFQYKNENNLIFSYFSFSANRQKKNWREHFERGWEVLLKSLKNYKSLIKRNFLTK